MGGRHLRRIGRSATSPATSKVPAVDPLAWIDERLADLADRDLLRTLRSHDDVAGPWLDLEGRRVLHLCSNSYLGLASHDDVVAAAAAAAASHGTGTGSARLVTGAQQPHRALERDLAAWKGTDDALLFSSGYLANLGVLQALAGPGDTIVSDELNHASIVDGCRLSRAEVRVFRHGDAEHAAALLADAPGRRVLVTDGVFSMDGDTAPLSALCDVAERHGAAVVVDDAHGSGVLGPDGRGTVAAQDCEDRVHAIVATLSKSLASQGGYVVGSARLVAWLRNRARGFVFDTALAPPAVAAAHAALAVARAEPWRRRTAVLRAQQLADGLRDHGWDVPPTSTPIVPVTVGSASAALSLMERLLRHDVLAVAIRPPTVPDGTARVRATTMASHTEADIEHALAAFGAAEALAA